MSFSLIVNIVNNLFINPIDYMPAVSGCQFPKAHSKRSRFLRDKEKTPDCVRQSGEFELN